MQSNDTIEKCKQELLQEISALYSLAESLNVDYDSSIYVFIRKNLARARNKINRIGKKKIEKKPVVSESLTAFIGDRVYKSPESNIGVGELYSFYCQRCRLKGLIPAKKLDVIKALKARFGNDIESKVVKIKGKVIRCYIGFDYKK